MPDALKMVASFKPVALSGRSSHLTAAPKYSFESFFNLNFFWLTPSVSKWLPVDAGWTQPLPLQVYRRPDYLQGKRAIVLCTRHR